MPSRALPILMEPPHHEPAARRSSYALRVSVIETCNLRCGYCAPNALAPTSAQKTQLDPRDHAQIAPLFLNVPVRKVRFTGGEPLLRPDLVAIVGAWRAALPKAELALTTNGTRLAAHAEALCNAGIDRVTIHLDTLRPERYAGLMGFAGSPERTLEAMAIAQRVFRAVKLNVVIQRDRNDDEIEAFLALSRQTGVEVRFIEIMTTGSADTFARDAFVAGAEIVGRADGSPLPREDASAAAQPFVARNGVRFGVIASDTEPFCAPCDRLRLTAEGHLRGCLYQPGGVALGAALRRGDGPAALASLIEEAVRGKRSWHPNTNAARVPFSMAAVGG